MSEAACLHGMQTIIGVKSASDVDPTMLRSVLATLARRVLVTDIPVQSHVHIEFYEHLVSAETR
jgi:hypothetical protein